MKSFVSLFSASLLALALTACGDKGSTEAPAQAPQASEPAAETAAPATEENATPAEQPAAEQPAAAAEEQSAAPAADAAAEAAAPAAPAPAPVAAVDAAAGKSVFNKTCAMCHAAGVAGAPKPGDKADWGPRIAQGHDTLYKHAIGGFTGKKGMMPAKGGNPSLSDDEVKSAVEYMVGLSS